MKTLTFALIFAVSALFSVNTVFSANYLNNDTAIGQESNSSSYIYVRVYEDGAIWVYVYTEDGSFVGKYIEQSN